MIIRWVCGVRGMQLTLRFRPPARIPAGLFLRFAAASEPGQSQQTGALWAGARLRCPSRPWLTQPVPAGGPGRELPPEAAADRAATEVRPAGQHLRPGQSGGPPGAGGEFREGQGPAPQQPPAEEEQAAGERCRCRPAGPLRTPPFPAGSPHWDRSPSMCTVRPCAPNLGLLVYQLGAGVIVWLF